MLLFQEEFGCELNRLETVMSPSKYDNSRLFARKLGYNGESITVENMESIQTYDSVQSLFSIKRPHCSTLVEEFRKSGDSYNMFNQSNNIDMLNIEKTSPPPTPFCKVKLQFYYF
ncbi:unnamed protein product [Wuchereria bancrofti]|uniref:Uncharacterized protein n=1 Tax=Wuchereria bancrofti TaxID=6293 RepID=A0A3P7FTY4_WUCBA|nr:unnamed protein product [Wuchereria bancrofti]